MLADDILLAVKVVDYLDLPLVGEVGHRREAHRYKDGAALLKAGRTVVDKLAGDDNNREEEDTVLEHLEVDHQDTLDDVGDKVVAVVVDNLNKAGVAALAMVVLD